MADLSGFDANQIEPSKDFSPVPEGKYEAVLTGSDHKPTKSRSGSYLELTFQIIAGEYQGRRIWARLNLENPNATAVMIAKAELATICRAVGVVRPRDSRELHNIPLVIQVCCKRRDDTGELGNEIKDYFPRSKSHETAGNPAGGHIKPPWMSP